jgi:hypothetical protein
MEKAVTRRLQTVQFGKAQTYKNITILPVISPADGAFQYRTLGEALAKWEVAITAVSVSGSVKELKVISRGSASVLLLDGEELSGARRNRVLSASVLLKDLSETRIPVKCAEPDRWSYTSKLFRESGNLLAYGSRSRMARSVQHSLERSGSFHADESEHQASSPTSSLNDIFTARQDELRQCDEAFRPVPDQVGLLAIIDGQPAGLDMISLKSAYACLHTKLTRSYALEALLVSRPLPARSPEDSRKPGRRRRNGGQSSGKARPSQLAQSFLTQILAAAERPFPSIGHGTDFRYRLAAPKARARGSSVQPFAVSPQPSLIGSALVHGDEVIHASFFRLATTSEP